MIDTNDVLARTRDFYRAARLASEESSAWQELPLNEFWGGANLELLREVIDSNEGLEAQLAAILATDLFSHNAGEESTTERQLGWWMEYLRRNDPLDWDELPPALEESPLAPAAARRVVSGRCISADFLRHLTLARELERSCELPRGRFAVLELGAGYGGFARIFKLRHPRCCYVIVDIPESLYVAALFLQAHFPQARFGFVRSKEAFPDLLEHDFVFVPAVHADAVLGTRFEVFYNTCSLGEMSNAVIEHWMHFVQERLEVRYFFGLNRFLNTIAPDVHGFRLRENRCSVLFDEGWRILRWELEPPHTRCPYRETFVTRNLQIIAERIPIALRNPMADRRRAEALLEEVMAEDWYVHRDADNSMRLRDCILAPDLTMRGSLFRIWESLRLHRCARAARVMLEYLHTLRRARPFEETFYYLELLGEEADDLAGRMATVWGAEDPIPRLLLAHGDFNVVAWRGRYHALALALGAVDLVAAAADEVARWAERGLYRSAQDLRALCAEIDAHPLDHVPRLVEEGRDGYNIVAYRSQHHAIARAIGPIDLANTEEARRASLQAAGLWISADSLDALRRELEQRAARATRGPTPAA